MLSTAPGSPNIMYAIDATYRLAWPGVTRARANAYSSWSLVSACACWTNAGCRMAAMTMPLPNVSRLATASWASISASVTASPWDRRGWPGRRSRPRRDQAGEAVEGHELATRHRFAFVHEVVQEDRGHARAGTER